MREICTSGSSGGPGGAIPRGYPTGTARVMVRRLGQVDGVEGGERSVSVDQNMNRSSRPSATLTA